MGKVRRSILGQDSNPYNPGAESLCFMLAGPLPPPADGQSVSFEMLCNGLLSRGYDCRIIDLKRKKPSLFSRITFTRSMELVHSLVRFVGGLAKNYRRVYITIAQSRAGFMRDALMIWAAWIRGCRIIVHLKGGNYDNFYARQPRLLKFLIRHTLRRVSQIIVLSEILKTMYSFDPVLGDRIVVVPNGMPIEVEGRSRELCQEPTRILFLSNMVESKGYYDVLEAVRILRQTTSMQLEAIFSGLFFLSSVGERGLVLPEEAEARFLECIEAASLADIVRYVGPVNGLQKWRLFETSDFFVLPSNYDNEGQPISIIEAMAYGCVVISTNFRAIPDLVVDGVTGRLIEYGRPDQIADAIRRIAMNPSEYASMSKAATERYRKMFTKQRHLDTIIPILESA